MLLPCHTLRVKRAILFIFLAGALSACRPDTIALNYRFPPGEQIHYRMEAHAEARWNLEGRGVGTYDAVFDVVERVTEDTGEGAIVRVTMTPVEVSEKGLPSPGLDPRSFILRAGPNGEVLEVVEIEGVPAGVLENDQIGLIATYRPPLPIEPVRLNGTWNAQQQLELPSVFQQVTTIGRLTMLERDADGRVAHIDYTGSGPLVRTLQLPQGQADLDGETEISIDADLDIDRGVLRGAVSSTTGTFDVRVVPPDRRAPMVGSLRYDLDVSLQRV